MKKSYICKELFANYFVILHAIMVYPQNFEEKIGFDRVREILSSYCLSSLGKEKVEEMSMSVNADEINEWQEQTHEFRRLTAEHDDFPLTYFFDVREAVMRIKPENTHMEEEELFDLMRSLSSIDAIVSTLQAYNKEGETQPYPALLRLTDDVLTFPQIIRRIKRDNSTVRERNAHLYQILH